MSGQEDEHLLADNNQEDGAGAGPGSVPVDPGQDGQTPSTKVVASSVNTLPIHSGTGTLPKVSQTLQVSQATSGPGILAQESFVTPPPTMEQLSVAQANQATQIHQLSASINAMQLKQSDQLAQVLAALGKPPTPTTLATPFQSLDSYRSSTLLHPTASAQQPFEASLLSAIHPRTSIVSTTHTQPAHQSTANTQPAHQLTTNTFVPL